MSRLIQADLSSAGKPKTRADSPLGFYRRRTDYAFATQQLHHTAQINAQVEHGSEHWMLRMHLHKSAVTGMNGQFGRRQREQQPAGVKINRRKFEDGLKNARSASGSLL
jgi:hypothetical protein